MVNWQHKHTSTFHSLETGYIKCISDRRREQPVTGLKKPLENYFPGSSFQPNDWSYGMQQNTGNYIGPVLLALRELELTSLVHFTEVHVNMALCCFCRTRYPRAVPLHGKECDMGIGSHYLPCQNPKRDSDGTSFMSCTVQELYPSKNGSFLLASPMLGSVPTRVLNLPKNTLKTVVY